MKEVFQLAAVTVCLLFAPSAAAVDTAWASFRDTAAAQEQLAVADLDTNLLSEAVFHATNAERVERGLPRLKYSQKAERAAALQSRLMRQRGQISHSNPDHPRWRTLNDRAEWAGLNYSLVAENVATAFGERYESGRPFYLQDVNGRTVASYQPEGKPIPVHTYASFAEALVTEWMTSPGHRANILNEQAKFIGISCLPGKKKNGLRKYYCTQVFYTPMPQASHSTEAENARQNVRSSSLLR